MEVGSVFVFTTPDQLLENCNTPPVNVTAPVLAGSIWGETTPFNSSVPPEIAREPFTRRGYALPLRNILPDVIVAAPANVVVPLSRYLPPLTVNAPLKI
jgi:hypothetical protein